MRPNPNDPYSKVLIVTGQDADQTLIAAQAVACTPTCCKARTVARRTSPPCPTRPARRSSALGSHRRHHRPVGLRQRRVPARRRLRAVNVYFRIPPDLFYSERQPNAILQMVYRYNSIPIGPISSIQVRVNNAFLGSLPLIPGSEPSRQEDRHSRPGREPAPILQLALLRLHLSAAQEGRLHRHHPHQHAGRHPARHLSSTCAATRITRQLPNLESSPTPASPSPATPT
jgi:cellulose synthase (UDP-forming)